MQKHNDNSNSKVNSIKWLTKKFNQCDHNVGESNLWLVSREFTNEVFPCSYISLKNALIPATRRQHRWTPGQGPNTQSMALHGSDPFTARSIPNLHMSWWEYQQNNVRMIKQYTKIYYEHKGGTAHDKQLYKYHLSLELLKNQKHQ
jgi:hypothetical protein